MTYIDKYYKYITKLNSVGGDSELIPLAKIRTDMILYTITLSTNVSGGHSDIINSIINNEYNKVLDINESRKKNYSLGIKQINKISTNIDFRIIPNNQDDTSIRPVFKSGTFSSIYQLKNQYNSKDTKKYILRLFDNTEIHICELKKIRHEYNIFLKYLIHIYYYGTLNIFKIGKTKPTLIDYIITKQYNTNYNSFTLLQKYKFLINNIQMLLDLRKQNCFHSDYKMSNIGWDDNLNIVLIDYDKNTIMNISNNDIIRKIKDDNNIMTKLNFPYTHIPKYLIHPNNKYINSLPIETFDKYSVGGLLEIIMKLKLPINLINEFKLNDSYENIFTYEKMLEKLNIILLSTV
jgi:hypothetical protein